MGLNHGTRGQLIGPGVIGGSAALPPIEPPTLAEVGIDKKLSAHARKSGELLTKMKASGERDVGLGGDRKSQSRGATVMPPTLAGIGLAPIVAKLATINPTRQTNPISHGLPVPTWNR